MTYNAKVKLKDGNEFFLDIDEDNLYPLELPDDGMWALLIDKSLVWVHVDNVSYVEVFNFVRGK